MKETLQNALNGLDGKSLVTEDIEEFIDAIREDEIPEAWLDVAYPTMEDLPGYLNDLLERVDFLKKWHTEGPPKTFWVTALFEPGDFFIAIMYIHAMKEGLTFHELSLEIRFDRYFEMSTHDSMIEFFEKWINDNFSNLRIESFGRDFLTQKIVPHQFSKFFELSNFT